MKDKLARFSLTLVDQRSAKPIVLPYKDAPGYWFGGGNMVEDAEGTLYLVGRYRNAGDSRTGLSRGERGLELAIFRSVDGGESFQKILSFSKQDLDLPGKRVISIEGASLCLREGKVELYVSTEKDGIGYPEGFKEYQKKGTGVWSIDRISASSVERLQEGRIESFYSSADPARLHVKDPTVVRLPSGREILLFCTHPFTWASSNSAYMIREPGNKEFGAPVYDFLPRGPAWDVAVTRATDILTLPEGTGGLREAVSLLFYDGAECLRPHEQSPGGVQRPRGYSCEEIGGLAWFPGESIQQVERISQYGPLFLSPFGTGSSRYVHTLKGRGGLYATWQQSSPTGSQPLLMHRLSWDAVNTLLS